MKGNTALWAIMAAMVAAVVLLLYLGSHPIVIERVPLPEVAKTPPPIGPSLIIREHTETSPITTLTGGAGGATSATHEFVNGKLVQIRGPERDASLEGIAWTGTPSRTQHWSAQGYGLWEDGTAHINTSIPVLSPGRYRFQAPMPTEGGWVQTWWELSVPETPRSVSVLLPGGE